MRPPACPGTLTLSGWARPRTHGLPVEVCTSVSALAPDEFAPPPPIPNPLLIVISGPSGVGKDVTLKRMKEKGAPFHFLVTNTTRPRRPSEVDGVDYHFITPEEFNLKLGRDEFLEHAVVYSYKYGNSKNEIETSLAQGQDVILRIDVQGSETIRRKVEGAIFIFMIASSSELERRLRARHTESEQALQIRLRMSAIEMKEMYKFDYIVVNRDDELDRTVEDIQAVIHAEKLRARPRVVRFL
jgi:guanylate kinase